MNLTCFLSLRHYTTGGSLTRIWVLYEIWKTVTVLDVSNLQILAYDVDFKDLERMFYSVVRRCRLTSG